MNSQSMNVNNPSVSNAVTSNSTMSVSKRSKSSKKLFGLIKQKSKIGNSNIGDDKLKPINKSEAISTENNLQDVSTSLGMLLSYDTTLIPYLKELFAKELEDELNEMGFIENSGLYAQPQQQSQGVIDLI